MATDPRTIVGIAFFVLLAAALVLDVILESLGLVLTPRKEA